jgi:putative salt-induced outer membrane protein YdiY
MRKNKMKYLNHIGAVLVIIASTGVVAEEEAKSPWKSSAELGYVETSGNTNATSIKAAIDVSYEVEKWLHAVHANALSVKTETTDSTTGETRDERIAAKWFVSGKTDYKLDEFNYFYGLITYEDDRFNGFDYQSKLGLGYGHWFLKSDVHKLKAEIGPGMRAFKVEQIPPPEGPIDTSTQTESLLRLNGNYAWAVSKTSEFSQDLTADYGEDQEEWQSVTALKANVNSILAMKLSHTVKYLDKVAPGVEHYDRITGVTLVFKF